MKPGEHARNADAGFDHLGEIDRALAKPRSSCASIIGTCTGVDVRVRRGRCVVIVHRRFASLGVLAFDVGGLVGILMIAQFLRIGRWMPDPLWPLMLVVAVTLALLYVLDTYGVSGGGSAWNMVVRTLTAVVGASLVLGALAYVVGSQALSGSPVFWRGVLPVGMFGFICWALVVRLIAWQMVRSREVQQRLLVAGEGDAINRLIDDLRRDGMPVQLIRSHGVPAIVGPQAPHWVDAAQTTGGGDSSAQGYDAVVVADELTAEPEQVRRLVALRLSGVRIYSISEFYELVWGRVPLESLGDSWLLGASGFTLVQDRVSWNLKRIVDVVLSSLGLALASPIMIIAAFAVWAESGLPVLFRQTRSGCRGVPYRLLKIRTMIREAERDGPRWASVEDPRVTRVGRILRRSRIDELPQMWNVLRGEMSFVGPRPERPEFVGRLREEIPYYDMRHMVKPGITGWAQVMHRYGASVDDARIKLEFDLYYIKHYSPGLDLAILLKTARVVLFGRGR